jgi:hypothetical protein
MAKKECCAQRERFQSTVPVNTILVSKFSGKCFGSKASGRIKGKEEVRKHKDPHLFFFFFSIGV